ncbi:MAG: 50S ribosomal protein L29 [Myxococcota bacterium]|jgi:ribosomal protein L29|nr:50S ribosomal protein L29 [Myxococcota bacterium]OQC40784.1 MAG: 50S ribosomal protein L29 [Deltaproteobacteria bacterium ADurb.Bin058]HHW96972.1 50S ribosomal protein L29 [Oligoflexales bacterium]MBP8970300.1 50S ribosomal protein L29 [Myxococcota bacterium]HOE82550.1 50S ribosomal protein L29 [Myxococcota bacterium]
MKAYKTEELRSLTDEELIRREQSLRKTLFDFRMKLAVGQLTKFADITATKRNLARVLTELQHRRAGLSG